MENKRRIILNSAKCLICNDIIISYHVHDYNTCSCGNISVDGGLNYIRRGYVDNTKYRDIIIYSDAPFKIVRQHLHWGTYGKSGDKELAFIPIAKMTVSHLKNILDIKDCGAEWIRDIFTKELEYRDGKKTKIKKE